MGRRMDDRNVGSELQDERGDRREEDRPRRRQFSGVVKIFGSRGRPPVIVEFSPDNQEEMNDLSQLVSDQRADPTLDRCIMLCQEARVRARVLLGGQYVGHIFADGSCDKGVQNLL